MLKYRILTALVLIPLVIAAIFFLPLPAYAAVCTFIMLLAAWEWAPFMGWRHWALRLLYALFILLVFFAVLLLVPLALVMAAASLLWFLLAIYLVYLRNKIQLPQISKWLIGLLGCLILIPFLEALFFLHRRPAVLLYLLVVVWLVDSMAYFSGKRWGQRKLAPLISPGKTLEGAYMALMIGAIAALAGQALFQASTQPPLAWIMVTLPAVIAALAGDLFESFLKRQQSIKDSGQLLPGHGGILDRIDSLLAAAPVFVLGVISKNLL